MLRKTASDFGTKIRKTASDFGTKIRKTATKSYSHHENATFNIKNVPNT